MWFRHPWQLNNNLESNKTSDVCSRQWQTHLTAFECQYRDDKIFFTHWNPTVHLYILQCMILLGRDNSIFIFKWMFYRPVLSLICRLSLQSHGYDSMDSSFLLQPEQLFRKSSMSTITPPDRPDIQDSIWDTWEKDGGKRKKII